MSNFAAIYSAKFSVGDQVRKPEGYPFPGEVVARFLTKAGELRYVVESDAAPGLLHIFSEPQLGLGLATDG